MQIHKLSTRKPDLLDELNEFRHKRRQAYERGKKELVLAIDYEIKSFRLKNGWEEEDANAEFLEGQQHDQIPFSSITGKDSIRYDVIDRNGIFLGLSLSINQLSKFYARTKYT